MRGSGALETGLGAQSRSSRRAGLASRLAVAAGLLFLEKFCLNFFVDFQGAQAAQDIGATVRIAQHWGFRFLVTLGIALALFTFVRGRERLAEVDREMRNAPYRLKWLLLHALLLPPIAASSFSLYGDHGLHIPFALLISSWLLLTLAAVPALFAALAPWPLWWRAARKLGVLWLYAAIAGAGAASAMEGSQTLGRARRASPSKPCTTCWHRSFRLCGRIPPL